MKREIINFLNDNERNSYYYYLRRNNGTVEERREYILDLLLQYLLQADMLFYVLDNQHPIFNQVEEILNQDLPIEEKIRMLKFHLFMKGFDTYNAVIEMIKYLNNIFDSKTFAYILQVAYVISNNQEQKVCGKVNKINECVNYLIDEMETLSDIKERKRVAC